MGTIESDNRIAEDTIASLEAALRVDPDNRTASGRIAELHAVSTLGYAATNLSIAQANPGAYGRISPPIATTATIALGCPPSENLKH